MKSALLKLVIIPIFAASAAAADAAPRAATADEALARLMAGNQRFVGGAAEHPRADGAARAGLVSGQRPFAAVLACADSRVAPEILFDQGLGDVFTVRVAGNIAGPDEQGSLDYAAEHLGVPVIMVLGHTGCGAVGAAVSGGHFEGGLAGLVKCIEPAVRAARAHGAKGAELAPAAVEENVRLNALALLRKDKIIKKLAAEGKVKVTAAVYDLGTGEVRLLDLKEDLEAERKAKARAMRGLLGKLRDGTLEESERAELASGLGELVPGLD